MINRKLYSVLFLLLTSSVYAQQPDMLLIPYREGNLWGYARADKKVIISAKYDDARLFSEGLASVKTGSKYGYINQLGQEMIPAKFTVANPFRKGYIPDQKKAGGDSILFAGVSLTGDGSEICIDITGKTLFKCPAISENSVAENAGPIENVVRQKNYSLKDNNGLFDKIIDDYQLKGNNETFYVAAKNGLYGVFNTKYDTIVPFLYQEIKVNRSAETTFLEIKKDGLSGILNGEGKTLFEPVYLKLQVTQIPEEKILLIIKKEGRFYLKDLNNQLILPKSYADITFDKTGFILTSDELLKGYYFPGNEAIDTKYREITPVNGTKYFLVRTRSGKPGYINNTGDEFFTE